MDTKLGEESGVVLSTGEEVDGVYSPESDRGAMYGLSGVSMSYQ